MTAYFDDVRRELHAVRDLGDTFEAYERLRAIESRMVADCSCTAMQECFPATIRLALHEVILQHGVESLPINTPIDQQPDYETIGDYIGRLQRLESDLHSVFHAVAQTEGYPHGDNPRAGFMRFVCLAEQEREELMATRNGTTVEAYLEAHGYSDPPEPSEAAQGAEDANGRSESEREPREITSGLDPERPDLYDVATLLYCSANGSNESAYAPWSDYTRTPQQDVAYLRTRLANWSEPLPWSKDIDDAFRAWVEAILVYVEPKIDKLGLGGSKSP